MSKQFTRLVFFLVLFLPAVLLAQQKDHQHVMKQRLDSLSALATGLHQSVQLTMTGVSIQDYLIALGKTNNLSISIDPKLNFTVNDIFNGVTAEDLLLFMARKYNLDIGVVGAIIYVTPYIDPAQFIRPPVKEPKVSYLAATNALSLQLDNDSLVSVARKITQVSGKNVIVPNVLLGKRVSGFIAAGAFDATLEKLAYTNELNMVRTSDNFYLFQPLGESEELYINGDKNTAVRRTFKQSQSTGGGANTGLITRVLNGHKVISADAVN